jgi:putative OPT family oligopeptide transporter
MNRPLDPYVPASKSLPELTPGVIVLGALLAVVFSAMNTYFAMIFGLTVSASVPAAVVSFLVLRGNILQNNAVQTAATSGEALAAGGTWTLPALLFLGIWPDIGYMESALIASLAGLLGVLFTSPLRRALIDELPLQFPEGIATVEVLKVADRRIGLRDLTTSAAVAAAAKIGSGVLNLWADGLAFGGWAGNRSVPIAIGVNGSSALLGVGYIVGPNVALVLFAGAVIDRYVLIPAFALYGSTETIATEMGSLAQRIAGMDAIFVVQDFHRFVTRYAGIGVLVVAGLWSVYRLRTRLRRGFAAGLQAYRRFRRTREPERRTDRDIPLNVIAIAVTVAVLALFVVSSVLTDSWIVGAVVAALGLGIGFVFSLVAGHATGLVGFSNLPVSAVAIVAALSVVAIGVANERLPTILIATVVCCAASVAGGSLQSLRAGQLVGATPWRQHVMQIVGVVAAAASLPVVLSWMHRAFVHLNIQGPQSRMVTFVAAAAADGRLPTPMIAIGIALGAVVIAVDVILARAGSRSRAPAIAFAVGMYLPFDLVTPIVLGAVIRWLVERAVERANSSFDERMEVEQRGILAAAGFIAGEALAGLVIAIPAAITGRYLLLAPFGDRFVDSSVPTLVLVATVMVLLYQLALAHHRTDRSRS